MENIRQRIESLPSVREYSPLVNERAAQAARSVLAQTDPSWEERLKQQIDTITKDIKQTLDFDTDADRFSVTPLEIRGIIANAITRTSSQCALDIGYALTTSPAIRTQFETKNMQADTNQPTLRQEYEAL